MIKKEDAIAWTSLGLVAVGLFGLAAFAIEDLMPVDPVVRPAAAAYQSVEGKTTLLGEGTVMLEPLR